MAKEAPPDRRSLGEPLVEYTTARSAPPSHRMRADVRRINAGQEVAHIADILDKEPPDAAPGRPYTATLAAPRHFTETFESGGEIVRRVLGRRWERQHRPWLLHLNGEPTGTLDYQAMFINLAYARMGTKPVGATPDIIPRLENYRRGIKRSHGGNAL